MKESGKSFQKLKEAMQWRPSKCTKQNQLFMWEMPFFFFLFFLVIFRNRLVLIMSTFHYVRNAQSVLNNNCLSHGNLNKNFPGKRWSTIDRPVLRNVWASKFISHRFKWKWFIQSSFINSSTSLNLWHHCVVCRLIMFHA